MRLHVLGSSSRGNAYLLRSSSGEALLLELGLRWRDILSALEHQLGGVVAALVSHEHGDHARSTSDALAAFVPTVMSPGTAAALSVETHPALIPISSGKEVRLGRFRILAFDTRHDAREPLGFLIRHPDMGTLLFATDTYYLPYRFTGLTHILIECNYRSDILRQRLQDGLIDPARYDRTISSHMSFDTCCMTLSGLDLSSVRHIVLIHLSDDNSHAQEMQQAIARRTARSTYVATPGLQLSLTPTPF